MFFFPHCLGFTDCILFLLYALIDIHWVFKTFLLTNILIKKVYLPGLYLGFANALFWASGDNLGLTCPANSCKQVASAAGDQGKPKHCRALKAAKGPLLWFKLSLSLRRLSFRVSIKHICHVDNTSQSTIVMVTYFSCYRRWFGFKT